MRIVASRTLTRYAAKHPDARIGLMHWHQVTKQAAWRIPDEITATMSKAVLLNGERARFEIQGGKFRLVAAFDFRRQIAFVKFIGTHAEYDRIDAPTVSMF